MEFNSNKDTKFRNKKCACGKQAVFYLRIDGTNSVFHFCEDCARKMMESMLDFLPYTDLEENKTYSRREYKNHMKGWTNEEIEILKSGLYIEQLMEKLGKTEMSIRMKASRIGYEIPSKAKETWNIKVKKVAKR